MSETVRYKGTLTIENKLDNESLENQCKRICETNGLKELTKWTDTYEELLCDELCDKYIIIEDVLYKLDYDEKSNYDYFAEAELNRDGTISFHTMFYNGACCLNEAIEDAVSNLIIKGDDLNGL